MFFRGSVTCFFLESQEASIFIDYFRDYFRERETQHEPGQLVVQDTLKHTKQKQVVSRPPPRVSRARGTSGTARPSYFRTPKNKNCL
jgi:hypothetical protein